MRDHHATLGQDQLDVTQTEAEDVIQPHRLADDLGRQPMPRVGGGLWRHSVNLARLPLQAPVTVNLAMLSPRQRCHRHARLEVCSVLLPLYTHVSPLWTGQPTAYPAVQKTEPPQTKAGLVGWPVRDLVLLPRDVVAAIPVSLDTARQHPGLEAGALPYSNWLSGTNEPIHAPRWSRVDHPLGE
jgi:hypothetical protein